MKKHFLVFALLAPLTSLLSGCGEQANACGMSLKDSALFQSSSTTALSADLEAARTAALAAEGAHAQEAIFAEKIALIAKDPKASEQWATLVKGSGTDARGIAKSSGVAVDMPMQANRLRAAGVPAEEVSKLIDATKSEFSPDETAALLAASATASEEQGPIEGLGSWTAEQVKRGLRGAGLEKELRSEHQIRGRKAMKNDEAGKKTTICHRPPGNPNNAKTHEVGPSALAAHLAHGDTEGPCPNDPGKPDAKGQDKDKDNDNDNKPSANDKPKGNDKPGGKPNGNGKK